MTNPIFSMKNKDEFINSNKQYIYAVTYMICNRTLSWENDDELSIALIAFNRACDTYDENKGNFLSYAKVLIKNSLIDYFRKNKNTPSLVFSDENENTSYIENKTSIEQFKAKSENEILAEEIKLFSMELLNYNIKFKNLVKHSPSHIDTRNSLLSLAFMCSKNESILNSLKLKKKLPTKEIMILTGMKRKFLEKWRKYIIAIIILITTKEFLYIRSYLNVKVGDENVY